MAHRIKLKTHHKEIDGRRDVWIAHMDGCRPTLMAMFREPNGDGTYCNSPEGLQRYETLIEARVKNPDVMIVEKIGNARATAGFYREERISVPRRRTA